MLVLNDLPINPKGRFVLHWMVAARRTCHNHALERSVAWANELQRPLVVVEPLSCNYPWASRRLHQFVIEGMQDNAHRFAASRAAYFPFVETAPHQAKSLFVALAKRACCIVTDHFPSMFLRKLPAALAELSSQRLESIDSCGLLPLSAQSRAFTTAHSFRRHLHKTLPHELDALALEAPLDALAPLPTPKLPKAIHQQLQRGSAMHQDVVATAMQMLSSLAPGCVRGGTTAGLAQLDRFVNERLSDYGQGRNHPDRDGSSGLSPWLHFGHLAASEVFARIAQHEGWQSDMLAATTRGQRSGWWGMSDSAEAYLDQLITWRELAFNGSDQMPHFERYQGLPEWARNTLAAHAIDPRPQLYDQRQLENAETSDDIWNAAQRQLVREGRMHNYLRMLWGKRIVEWTAHPTTAMDIMVELNNRYAIDGRDPSSYAGIGWVLGRYDRAWGPERPIFGKVRFMSSASTRRKLRLRAYLERYSA